LINPDITLKFP